MIEDSLMRSFLSMVGFIAVLAVVLFFFKKYAKKANNKSNSVDLNIVSKLNIQPKTTLYIIKAGVKTLLVGVTDHNIQTLSDLTEDKTPKSSFNIKKPLPVSDKELPELALPLAKKISEDKNPLSFSNFIKAKFKK
ncbi:MAG: flagellar biosynthetic protein FliO [FCB group bacterium]|jgi:flagellar biogenesis protein FliO